MNSMIYKLSFAKGVHFGKKGLSDSDSSILADTLFSALFIETLKLDLATEFLLEDLIISDTFPFIGDVLYLPKPMIEMASTLKTEDASQRKIFKKLKYLPATSFHSFVTGDFNAAEAEEQVRAFQLGEESTTTKVALESTAAYNEGVSQPYTVGTFHFYENAGLYFIAKGKQDSLQKLERVLQSLQYSGLGGKRNAGYGQFTFQKHADTRLEELLRSTGEDKVLLSTAMTESSEILAEILLNGRYLLKKRSGFIQSVDFSAQLVKKSDFYSFCAGSVFKKTFTGAIFDVGQNGQHPVYRYGKAMWLEV